MRRNLASSEESRDAVAEKLRETETAISAASRQVRELAASGAKARQELAEIEARQRHFAGQAARHEGHLGEMLRQRHRSGLAAPAGDNALQVFLSGRDPNQVARDWHYLRLLSRAKAELATQLATAAAESRGLAEAAREKTAQIDLIETRLRKERADLQKVGRERQATLARLAGQIRVQRREIGALQRDEQQLGRLIDRLSKPERKSAAAGRRQAPPASGKAGAQHSPKEADTSGAKGEFAALRGKLKLPVQGTVTGRFGTARPEGGSWKGLFIRAAEGSEVHAVAGGRIAFADWLRGFGNLIIVDHGDGFLSVYGNNQSVLKQVGDDTRAGEVVATAGSSGGNAESGLYFELRHLGQVFDPMKWVRPR